MRECASRLDSGVPAEEVMADMSQRYTTVRCMNVKTCLVRSMCKPSDEYLSAVQELCTLFPHNEEDIRLGRTSDDTLRSHLASLPPKWPDNVYRLKPTRKQMKECKRLSARSAIEKNKSRIRVDGRCLLATARHTISTQASHSLATLAFAIMLLTGRRTCEILNGRSRFEPEGEYSLCFTGIAKRKGTKGNTIVIPVLARSQAICDTIDHIRGRQKKRVLDNKAVSSRYQSLLGRTLAEQHPWKQCKRVHGLRGVYACMALRLFEWKDDASDAYVAMCILGHTGLHESLVYTTYHLGDDFCTEDCLGEGRCTPHQYVERTDGALPTDALEA